MNYQRILDFVQSSAKRLRERTGNIADIGISKINLTEEDLAIERGFKSIISEFGPDHRLFSEEENDVFMESENVWVADPISGTKNFIQGLPHYAISIAHVVRKKTVFAAVCDPSADELYTAYLHKGASMNGAPICPSATEKTVVIRGSSIWKDLHMISKTKDVLSARYSVATNSDSMALNYCWIAKGQYDGIVSFTKDSFPEFAGGFILQEAGGRFSNAGGEADISSTDRIFIGGNTAMYDQLLPLVQSIVS